MISEPKHKHWFVLRTKHNSERKVCEFATKAGFTCYLPEYTSYHKWSDRIKKIQKPLIPNNIFVKCKASDLNNLYAIPLAGGILKEFGKPAIVKDFEIKNLEIILREFSGENISEIASKDFISGEKVIVKRGQFKGLEGKHIRQQGNSRMIIEISAMQTAFSINIPASQVKKLASKEAHFQA